MAGKRGCSLKLAFLLHLVAFLVLCLGCFTPYWSTMEDNDDVHVGLYVSYTEGSNWELLDFTTLDAADTDENKELLYLKLAVSFGIVTIFLEFFLLQAYAFSLYNASCGKKYNPSWLMTFCLVSGLLGIATIVTFNKYVGELSTDVDDLMDPEYSQGLVMIFIASVFLASFFTACDKTPDRDPSQKF